MGVGGVEETAWDSWGDIVSAERESIAIEGCRLLDVAGSQK